MQNVNKSSTRLGFERNSTLLAIQIPDNDDTTQPNVAICIAMFGYCHSMSFVCSLPVTLVYCDKTTEAYVSDANVLLHCIMAHLYA